MEELNASVESGVFTSDDEKTIKGWYSDGNLSPAQVARNAFDLYLARRLALLPEEDALEIRQILRERLKEHRVVDDDSMGFLGPLRQTMQSANYDMGDRWLNVWTRDQYRESELTFHILAHELEHAILDVRLRRNNTRWNLPNLWERYFGKAERDYQEFLLERQAMVAEWAFSRAIPEPRRKELLEQVRNDRSLSKWERDAFSRWLENASEPVQEYLKREYVAGRYKPPEVGNGRIRTLIAKIVKQGMSGTLATLIAGVVRGTCATIPQGKGDNVRPDISRLCDLK